MDSASTSYETSVSGEKLINVVSPHGTDMLNIFLHNPACKVISAQEFVEDDGYDRYGPKSTMYDLFIISQNLDTQIYDYYHFQTKNSLNKDYKNLYYTSASDNNSFCDVHQTKYLILPNLEFLSYKIFIEIINISEHIKKENNGEFYMTCLNYSELTSLKITCGGVLFTPSQIGIKHKI